MTTDEAEDFIQRYNGFIQIYEVAQFVEPFQIWVPTELLEEAKEQIKDTYGLN